MNIPLHLVPASTRASLDVLELPELGSPIAGPVDMAQLLDLQSLMQRNGLSLQPTRMLYDRLYAFDRLAAAYGGSDAALRELAQQLFQCYQRAGEWIGLVH